jgi:hypothetical protein
MESITTPAAAPAATTVTASSVTVSAAVLEGSGVPRGAAATGYFRYGTTNPSSCSDTFGTRAPESGGADLGSGNASVPFTQAISGLTPNTTYYYCAVVSNSVGTTFGSVYSFVTPAAPVATTSAASSITNIAAYLNGSGNPKRAAATGWFRFSSTDPGTCDDSFGARFPSSGGSSLGSGSSAVAFSQYVTGLNPVTTYYYCAVVSNTYGTSYG